jgi:hypothetical protein
MAAGVRAHGSVQKVAAKPRSIARRETGVLPNALWSAADAVGDRVYKPLVPSNTQIRPGASAPASRRVDADWTSSGCKPTSLAVVST